LDLIKNIICSLIFTALPLNVIGQQGKVDATFNTLDDGLKGDGFDNVVRTLLLQSDESLIVGGDYTSLNGISSAYFTRLNEDGTIDNSFDTGIGFNGKVYASNIQSDGKIIAAGSFTSFNGRNAGRLIRLNNDGSQDLSFNTIIGATTGIISGISIQPDGKIIISGSFTKYNNVTVNRIARILPNGDIDTSFLTGIGSALSITNTRVLWDGKILVAGNFTSFNGFSSNRIIRLNLDGTVDTSFNIGIGFNDDVNAIAIQNDRKIILGGNFTSYNGNEANRIIRLNEDGSIDNAFLSSGFNNGTVQVIKTDSLDNIMVGGSFTNQYNGTNVNRVVLLNSNGTIKADFDIGSGPASASVLTLENNLEGSWFVGGSFSVFDGQNQGRLAKINDHGELDSSYLTAGIGFDNSVLKIISLNDKKTMVFGSFTKFNNNSVNRITKLLEDGSLDQNFNRSQSGANDLIDTALIQDDGKIIFGGKFTKYNDLTCNRIVRILPDGSIDNAFSTGAGFNNQIYSIAIQADNKIIAAGHFTRYNNDPSAVRIIRLLPDGSKDMTFNAGLSAEAVIEIVLIQPDGKILVGGRFTTFNGQPLAHLVRLNTDGSIDSGFSIGTGFNKNVYALALQSDGKIIVGGSFTTFNGITQKGILRLNSNGTLDNSFESGSGFNKGEVRTILIQPDDRILAGGTFSGTYKNNPSLRLIRLLKTGEFDASFSSPLNNKLFSLSFTSDYRLLIGGNFNSVSDLSKHRIARLKLCLESTEWNGSSWSNGYPSGGKEVFFKADYPNLNSAEVCSCTIDSGKTVTLLEGNTLGIEFSYLGNGILVLEDSASLYQSDDETINNGIIHLKRKTKPILRYDYTYWSSPVNNQKLIDVSPQTLFDKYMSYDETIDNWKIENPSNNMILGKGYIIRGPQEFSIEQPTTYEAVFKGIPNNGKIEIKLGQNDSFNLIGNPYPSAIDADLFLRKNEFKTKGALYFWTHNTPITNYEYSEDDYAVYNLVGGIGTRAVSDGINDFIPDGNIASGQAFFLKSNLPETIEFNNSMRIQDKNNAFFKIAKKTIEKHRIWLNFRNEKGAFKQTLLGYVDGATNGYDINFDGETLDGNQFVDFYSVIEDKKLVIQGRGLPFKDSDEIILGYKTTIAGEFTIEIDHADGCLSHQPVYLLDKIEGKSIDLSMNNYKFTTNKGTFTDRFSIHFLNENLKTNEFENDDNSLFISVKNQVITINSSQEKIDTVFIYDVSGNLLFKKRNNETNQMSISNFKSAQQVLLIQTVLKNDKKITKKIIF
jgi:uncharacterized delta-60 repeat protein